MSRLMAVFAAPWLLCLASPFVLLAAPPPNDVPDRPAVEVDSGVRAKRRTLEEAAQAHGLPIPPARNDFEDVLRQPIEFVFDNLPLRDVVQHFSDQFNVDIVLDAKGLADAAVDATAPVTLTLRRPVTFESAMKLILDEFDLTLVIQDEVLKVTSKDKADEIRTTKVYPVGDLLKRRRTWGPLIQAITSTIKPDSWDDNGGTGSIQPYPAGLCLIVSQTRDAHMELHDMLAKLRAEMPPREQVEKQVDTEPSTVVYHVAAGTGEKVSQAIRKLVAPTSWSGQGGDGEVVVVAGKDEAAEAAVAHVQQKPNDILIVRQTNDVHNQIEEMLDEIARQRYGGRMGGMLGVAFGFPAQDPFGAAAPPQAAPAAKGEGVF